MYLIKETLGISLVRIGELFGGRDHSTVIHSIRKVEESMQADPVFRQQVEDALAEVRELSGSGAPEEVWGTRG
jgi:chromosomal replication initiator protein